MLVSRAWGIEESIIGGAPKVTAVGDGSVYIENHGGLLSYSDTSLNLMCRDQIGSISFRKIIQRRPDH